ncbi:hypothetical protein, partial [Salmonella sp. s54412]|uniref:hypothetical protein n=1 Tax=Salmonella sp. s54412 TaxID=3160128 RepID=UPI00375530FD
MGFPWNYGGFPFIIPVQESEKKDEKKKDPKTNKVHYDGLGYGHGYGYGHGLPPRFIRRLPYGVYGR